MGLVFSLIILEISLRIVGFNQKPNNEIRDGEYTILCIGNSLTFGYGAPKGESYPDHLQALFDANTTFKVNVINQGKAAQNSAEVLRNLQKDIDTFEPNLIILRTGGPNGWNIHGYNQYYEREFGKLKGARKIASAVSEGLYKIKVFKLVRLLTRDVKAQLRKNRDSPTPASELPHSKIFEEIEEKILRQEGSYFNYEKTQNAIKVLTNCTGNLHEIPYCHYLLGKVYSINQEYEKAAREFMEGIKANPNFRGRFGDENHNFYALKQVVNNIDDEQLTNEIKKFTRKTGIEDILFSLDEHEKLQWAKSDIKEIVKIIKSNNVALLMQNYPPPTAGGEREINNILREVAKEEGIPFVDIANILREMWKGGISKKEYHYVKYGKLDEHLNSKGYKLMATHLFKKIIENQAKFNLQVK